MKKPKKCEWCGEELDSEEKKDPNYSSDQEVICDECYDEEYLNTCILCGESFEKARAIEDCMFYAITATRSGNLVLSRKSLRSGVYLITRWPFFADGMVEGHYYGDSFTRIRGFTPDEKKNIKQEEYQDDEVCRVCALKKEASYWR